MYKVGKGEPVLNHAIPDDLPPKRKAELRKILAEQDRLKNRDVPKHITVKRFDRAVAGVAPDIHRNGVNLFRRSNGQTATSKKSKIPLT